MKSISKLPTSTFVQRAGEVWFVEHLDGMGYEVNGAFVGRQRRLSDIRRMMLDLIFIAATVMFFLIAIVYVRGCERLQ